MNTEAPRIRIQESPRIRQWQQSVAIQLQRAGVLPKDTMGGHYSPSRFNPRARRQAVKDSALAAQQTLAEMPYPGIHPQTLNILEILLNEGRITEQEAGLLLQQIEPAYVLGIDVSHWQGDLSQEWWDNRANEQYKFAFIKALGGSVNPLWKDPKAIQNLERALEAKFNVGFYVFGNPSGAANTDPITDQVEAAKLYVGTLMPDIRLGMALDLEIDNGVNGSLINARMESAVTYAHNQSDIKAVWIYSSAGFLNARPGITLRTGFKTLFQFSIRPSFPPHLFLLFSLFF